MNEVETEQEFAASSVLRALGLGDGPGPSPHTTNSPKLSTTQTATITRMLLSPSLPLAVISLLLVLTANGRSSQESYSERLRLTTVQDGKLHSQFTFNSFSPTSTTNQVISSNSQGQSIPPPTSVQLGADPTTPTVSHHALLSSTITSVVNKFRLSSFHLSLSSGRWAQSWPLPPGASLVTPSGIHLEAWLENLEGETDLQEVERWQELRGALGGIFCTSIATAGVETGQGWADHWNGEGDELGKCSTLSSQMHS